jgi:hypothetical protein
MAALTAERIAPRKSFLRDVSLPCGAAMTFYRGGCVNWDASDVSAQPAGTGTDTDQFPVGTSMHTVVNSGAKGAKNVRVELFQPVECVVLANDGGGGALVAANLLSIVYFLDDQTVTSTSANNSKAGRLWKIDSDGCHVEMLRPAP